MHAVPVKEVSAFFPYYINIGRIIDIYATISKGYTEYEEVLIEKEMSRRKSKGLKGNHTFKWFSVEGEIESHTEDSSKETSKSKRIHTVASLLNCTIESLCRKGKVFSLIDPSGDENNAVTIASQSECGDIVIFTGDLALTETPRGARNDDDKIKDPSTAEKENHELEASRAGAIESVKQLVEDRHKRNIMFYGISVVLVFLTILSFIRIFFLQDAYKTLTLFAIPSILLCILILFLYCHIKNKRKNSQTINAIKNVQEKGSRISKVVIRTSGYDFICYLHDKYFYQCKLSDIITKHIKCLGIVHKPSTKNQLVAEVEVLALYL